jgi:predicted O-methyltransferase YrrM
LADCPSSSQLQQTQPFVILPKDRADRLVVASIAMDFNSRRRAFVSLARHLRDREFRREWLLAGEYADSRPRASTQYVFHAFPTLSGRVVPMADLIYRPFNLDPTERYCLGAMAQILQARRIFEFGTYDGATTLLLARCAPDAEIVTLDLPPDAIAAQTGTLVVIPEQVEIAGGIGARFRDQPEAARITQILGDSREVDLSSWFGTCDLVLVDGSHDKDIVPVDTRNAMRLVSSQGVVVWDD